VYCLKNATTQAGAAGECEHGCNVGADHHHPSVCKLIGGFPGALSLGRLGTPIVGVGMIPRGEVGVIDRHSRRTRH